MGAKVSRTVLAAAIGAAALASLASLAAPAIAAALEQREPTTAERASFEAFFNARQAATPQGPWPGGRPLFAPAFDIERQRGKPWRVIARTDSAPRRAHPDLCRQIRSSFIYDDGVWTGAAEAPQWYVWLATPAVPCRQARYTTLMDPAVPEGERALSGALRVADEKQTRA